MTFESPALGCCCPLGEGDGEGLNECGVAEAAELFVTVTLAIALAAPG